MAHPTSLVLGWWLPSRPLQEDRADWAVVQRASGTYLGEVVLSDVDPDNESASFRIALGRWLASRPCGGVAPRVAGGARKRHDAVLMSALSGRSRLR
ncbi:hypothetical protein FHX82_006141 [Amycolatopsis bartoniae]|uniref:Uncharacterized protein n=1 Tax=Amycolatopsis bartoniae TaxID=941986 RepID=A0A8H9J071_9PSEU|nr:hypothetical protein [Amycolatopsis bartoniae]MBB2939055.1 hypothetical protein [Amycolatopsis bartoniae]TVT06318.1 hypothetical protein FNH07_20405 [Amycolatopsis bartoniae]GHF65268.1 hypothetical protein GCM10017566_43500 [Amycolatopsis bartoniae]